MMEKTYRVLSFIVFLIAIVSMLIGRADEGLNYLIIGYLLLILSKLKDNK